MARAPCRSCRSRSEERHSGSADARHGEDHAGCGRELEENAGDVLDHGQGIEEGEILRHQDGVARIEFLVVEAPEDHPVVVALAEHRAIGADDEQVAFVGLVSNTPDLVQVVGHVLSRFENHRVGVEDLADDRDVIRPPGKSKVVAEIDDEIVRAVLEFLQGAERQNDAAGHAGLEHPAQDGLFRCEVLLGDVEIFLVEHHLRELGLLADEALLLAQGIF